MKDHLTLIRFEDGSYAITNGVRTLLLQIPDSMNDNDAKELIEDIVEAYNEKHSGFEVTA